MGRPWDSWGVAALTDPGDPAKGLGKEAQPRAGQEVAASRVVLKENQPAKRSASFFSVWRVGTQPQTRTSKELKEYPRDYVGAGGALRRTCPRSVRKTHCRPEPTRMVPVQHCPSLSLWLSCQGLN